jgi:hypothetical protein
MDEDAIFMAKNSLSGMEIGTTTCAIPRHTSHMNDSNGLISCPAKGLRT